jgi:tRNA(Arg) A34 adenosine deaminase TadA
MSELNELPEPWAESYRLAWEAYKAGSVPCGSVVVNGSGELVTRGRNRAYESLAPDGQLGNTSVAHAEINALIGLPAADYSDHVLYSSLEPCPLCLGATVMCAIGKVLFAGHDLWSGASTVAAFPEAIEKPPVVEGPLTERFGLFGSAIYLERLMKLDAQHLIVQRHRQLGYEGVAPAERLFDAKVLQAGERNGASLDELWPDIAALL